MSASDNLIRDYRAAFLRFLSRQDETARHGGYELGRSAIADGLSLLELVQIHHQVLADTVRDETPDRVPATLAAAAAFLVEVLAAYDMAQPPLRRPEAGPTSA